MDVITARGVANADSYDRLQHGNGAGQVVDWRPQSKCGAPAGNRSAAATQPVQAEGGQVIVPGSSFSHPSLSVSAPVKNGGQL